MLKIAITGNIASGKTEALEIFKKSGSYTINADEISHELLKDEKIKNKIIKTFGNKILKKDKIDRRKLAKIVFEDLKKLKKLEIILHPKILARIKKEYEKTKNANYDFFVVENPLLFEMNFQKFFDKIITISTDEKIAKKRYKFKDYEQRKKRLLDQSKKEKLSDFVITNNQSLKIFQKKIKQLSKHINKI